MFPENEITNRVPRVVALGSDFVSVPESVYCLPFAFVFPKFVPWKEEMDWIFTALKEGGFDQIIFEQLELSSIFTPNDQFFHSFMYQIQSKAEGRQD